MYLQMTRSSSKDAVMSGILLMVLTVLAVDLSTCFGQYGGGEMGAAMGKMTGGGIRGFGTMMGGGAIGGLGTMMGGGAISELGAMMGGGEMGRLGAMIGGGTGGERGGDMETWIGAMVRQGALTNAMKTITEAVHFIVGPQAKPDELLIKYTMSQRTPPRSMMEMLPYLPHLKRIARTTYGSWLATQKTGTAGKSPAQLQTDLDTIITKKAIEYMNRPQTQRGAAGVGTMAAMGAMIPRMIQGIAAQYQ